MDEKRLDRIEGKFDIEAKENATFRGELRQFMSNTSDHIEAVSKKAGDAKAAVEAHEKDINAHGAGVKREVDGKMVAWVTAGAAVLSCFGGVIGALAHKIMTKVGP